MVLLAVFWNQVLLELPFFLGMNRDCFEDWITSPIGIRCKQSNPQWLWLCMTNFGSTTGLHMLCFESWKVWWKRKCVIKTSAFNIPTHVWSTCEILLSDSLLIRLSQTEWRPVPHHLSHFSGHPLQCPQPSGQCNLQQKIDKFTFFHPSERYSYFPWQPVWPYSRPLLQNAFKRNNEIQESSILWAVLQLSVLNIMELADNGHFLSVLLK